MTALEALALRAVQHVDVGHVAVVGLLLAGGLWALDELGWRR